MNEFGGNWTENKIEILVEYAFAYLTIMNNFRFLKTIYYDGFAGSGFIQEKSKLDNKKVFGAAKRIVEIEKPIPFNLYYFVEKDLENFESLKDVLKEHQNTKEIYVVHEDCNVKIKKLSNFLKKPENKNYRVLSYIDPCGMQLRWDSIASLKGLGVDLWVLVPTGLGVNRLLKKNGDISDAWLNRLEVFLGMDRNEIKDFFYQKSSQVSLFGNEIYDKINDPVNRSAELYSSRLKEIFKFVSEPYILKNSTNSIMFHFFMGSNNPTAARIANDIIKKYNQKNG